MSNIGHVTVTLPPRSLRPIADMGPWAFWSRHDALGLPAEVAAALQDGTASEEQQGIARLHLESAKQMLLTATSVYPDRKTS